MGKSDGVVLLWMKNALMGIYEQGASPSPPPRGAIASSISRAVRSILKAQPETVVERAVRQARQEADSLYMLVVGANAAVQESGLEREREYLFLLAYLKTMIAGAATSKSEEELRVVTLLFVKEVLLLDGAVSQTSAERFGGQNLLFSDSASKLKEHLGKVDCVIKAL